MGRPGSVWRLSNKQALCQFCGWPRPSPAPSGLWPFPVMFELLLLWRCCVNAHAPQRSVLATAEVTGRLKSCRNAKTESADRKDRLPEPRGAHTAIRLVLVSGHPSQLALTPAGDLSRQHRLSFLLKNENVPLAQVFNCLTSINWETHDGSSDKSACQWKRAGTTTEGALKYGLNVPGIPAGQKPE